MKRRICLVMILSWVLLSLSAQKLKVMTYNLRFGELASMSEFADFIKSENPDIVFLQEVDWKTHRTRAPKQNGIPFINELAYGTGMFALYGKSIDYSGGYYGIGILSKYPFIRSERLLLPNPEPKKEQRSLLEATVLLDCGTQLQVMTTHLEVSTSAHRKAQLEFINQRALASTLPTLLGGDFNASPTSEEITEGMKSWDSMSNDDFTYSSTHPKIKIDYIYALPQGAFQLIETQVPQHYLSDHLPIVSILELR